MYDLQLLMEVLIDDYDLLVNGVDSDGIHFTLQYGMLVKDVDRYMRLISLYEPDLQGLNWKVYKVEGREYFLEVF